MPRQISMNRSANGSGSVKKVTRKVKGKEYTYWLARFTEGYDLGSGKQVQRTIYCKTQKEAAQKVKEATHDLDTGNYQAPNAISVKEWLETWIRDYTTDVKPSTAHLYSN